MRDLGFWKKYAFGENSENFQFFCVFWVIINSIHTSFIYISHVLCVFEIRRHISHFEKRVKSKFPIICLFFSSSRWGCVHCFRLSKSDINKTHHHGHKQLKNAWNHQHINSEPNNSKNCAKPVIFNSFLHFSTFFDILHSSSYTAGRNQNALCVLSFRSTCFKLPSSSFLLLKIVLQSKPKFNYPTRRALVRHFHEKKTRYIRKLSF